MEARFRAGDGAMPGILRGGVSAGNAHDWRELAVVSAEGAAWGAGAKRWGIAPGLGHFLQRTPSGGTFKMQVARPGRLPRGAYFSSRRVAFQNACCVCVASLGRLLQQPLEIVGEAGAVLVGEGVGAFGAPACAADLLLLMADEELHVDSRLVVNASAYADGGGIAT